MKKILNIGIVSLVVVVVASGCSLISEPRVSRTPAPVVDTTNSVDREPQREAVVVPAIVTPSTPVVESVPPTPPEPVVITAPDETAKAETALRTFFDLASKKKYIEAVAWLSPDASVWDSMAMYSKPAENDKATILKNFCQTGTCLKTKILSGKQVSNEDYEIILQFLNADGTIYVFGPCCGATEKEMPSADTFTYTVKKVEGKFLVTRAPLYRP